MTGAGLVAVADPPPAETPPADPKAAHHEKPGDPYIPIARETQRKSPAARPSRNGFTSVQVNVDANGDNIVGDAGNEPSIAVDPTDRSRMAIGWRQFDTIENNFRQAGYGWSSDAGATWRFPGVIEQGNFRSDPVLASTADGVFLYYSLQGDFLCHVFVSVDGGRTWGNRNFAYGGDKAWFTVDTTDSPGRDHAYVAWSTAGNPHFPNQFSRSTNGGTEWMNPIELLDPKPIWGTLDMDADGNLYVCGWAFGVGIQVLRSCDARDDGKTPTWEWTRDVDMGGTLSSNRGPNPGGLLGQAWLAVDRSGGATDGNIYVLSSVDPPGSDPLDVNLVRSEDGGETWSAPIRVNDDGSSASAWQWFGTMSVAPNGRLDVIWNDTRESHEANMCALYYAYSPDGGRSWSHNEAVSPEYNSWLGWPQQNKMGDYYDMVSDDDGVSIAWAATFNGEQDVYYLRIEPDDCRADLDGDGVVAFDDLLRVLDAWGACKDCPEDLDGDGEVGLDELLAVLSAWGPCPLFCCTATDDCGDAPEVGDGRYAFSTVRASDDGPSLPAECDEGNGTTFRRDVWVKYVAPCTGTATASVCESDYNTKLAVYDADACPGDIITCSDDACGEDGTRSEATFAVVEGASYLVRIGGRTATGRGTLELSCAP